MAGIMLVKQTVEDVDRFTTTFRDPELDAVRRAHGLAVTGLFRSAEEPPTVIVVMDMADLGRARTFAASETLAAARARAGAVGAPDGVWYGDREA